ncbi:tyrosine-type recombinase/integrase [Botrimarina mediterranea]|uniref:Phage integrase family protein n=1 Tax=Botrimarina mediterranea TaxID=2528022 RepID=A0A518K5X4_9BACT|nr:tyrosine-type recombinase/integrase [Botrimarina mediterranea]QDV73192.1 Phage integrase family protein [Botrimarina mediterranea]
MTKKRAGRKGGKSSRGFYFRSGRGWYALRDGKSYPLLDADGVHHKDPKLPERVARESHARWLTEQTQADQQRLRDEKRRYEGVTLLAVCQAYLAHAKATGAAKTHHDRADTLFDFCFGLPPEFRPKDGVKPVKPTANQRKAMAASRIHDGYGRMLVTDLLPLHIDQWLNAHPSWGGGRRSRIQAVKRALNYAKDAGLVAANPIVGYSTPRAVGRVTDLSPEQEAALLKHANRPLALAIQVCIRTGARPGCEFAALTRKHVRIAGDRMEWTFSKDESKTKKLRVLRIRDPEMIQVVEQQMAAHPKGPLFRNTTGKPWTRQSLSGGFRTLKRRLEKQGVEFDRDACMYSCRHTFAKRTLQGYWTGRMVNIETVAGLMGNSPQVCRDHYLQWSEIDNERLWEAC